MININEYLGEKTKKNINQWKDNKILYLKALYAGRNQQTKDAGVNKNVYNKASPNVEMAPEAPVNI